jgi:DNA-binding NarL/FixJ family response regulator
MTPIRVLLADDHELFTTGLQALLATEPGVQLVGLASTGHEAVRAAAELRPDVVVMDLHMPGLGGIEATRQIVAAQPDVAVLVLTMFEDADTVLTAMRAGARGYLLKGANRAQLCEAIATVADGQVVLGTAPAAHVLAASATSGEPYPFPRLTDRERDILALVATGLDNRAIARRLSLSEKTIRNNVSAILTKLAVPDRSRAIVAARDAGLGLHNSPPRPGGQGAGSSTAGVSAAASDMRQGRV